jgi:uroporphyrinogen III methyltransferase / synthase
MSKTLSNLRVLVTRSPEQAGDLTQRLQGRGAEVIEVPVISIQPPDNWSEVDACLDRLHTYNWLIFASSNAVGYLTSRMCERGQSLKLLAQRKIAAIGTATLKTLETHSLIAAFCPSRFVAESLVEEFPGYPHLTDQRILWPRTDIGRSLIADKLTAAGAQVDSVIVYRTCEPDDSDRIAAKLLEVIHGEKIDVITLASAQSARNLSAFLKRGSQSISRIPQSVRIVAIGPETTKAAVEHLGRCDMEANPHTMDGIVSVLERFIVEGDAMRHR